MGHELVYCISACFCPQNLIGHIRPIRNERCLRAEYHYDPEKFAQDLGATNSS